MTPCLSARSACAPWRSRSQIASLFPFAAAKWRGVEPVVPMMGAEESLLEYRFGSLDEMEWSNDDVWKGR